MTSSTPRKNYKRQLLHGLFGHIEKEQLQFVPPYLFFFKGFQVSSKGILFLCLQKRKKRIEEDEEHFKGVWITAGTKNQHVKISCTKTNACCSDHLLIILQWIQKLLQLQIKLKRYSRQLLYTIITPINATSAFYSLLPKKLKIKTQTITQKMCIFYCVIRTQRLTCTFY